MLVSANGGWNLLIGTFPEGNGAWVALDGDRVPSSCRLVFQEAAKDECFGKAAIERIAKNPMKWLALVPAKLRATLDHTSIAADHLVESGALTREGKKLLSYPEVALQRILFLLALCGAWALANPIWKKVRHWLLVFGAFGFLGLGATWGWLSVLLLVGPSGIRRPGVAGALVSVASTMVVHAVFFGAGRYSLPLLLLAAPLSALGLQKLLQGFGSAEAVRPEV